jgi:REP element-mobilizing transposase RayT
MARRLRVEFEGAIYHVTARGNERSDIFKHDQDCERYLEKLQESVERYGIRMYVYVLMRNHIHFLLETPRGNLSAFMQQLNTSYTMYYNVSRRRTGHLFSGRYKAKLVEGNEYLLTLTRYIHLNPVKVRKVRTLPLAERRNHLRQYKWSTYRQYIGLNKRQDWIDYDPLSAIVWETSKDKKGAYRRYVEEGLTEDDIELQEALKRSSKAIGTTGFRRWVEQETKRLASEMGSPVDVAMRRIECGTDPDEVIETVCRICKVEKPDLQRRRSVSDARLLAIKLLDEVTCLSQRAIGQRLGLRDGSGLYRLKQKLDDRLSASRKLRRQLKKLQKECCLNR